MASVRLGGTANLPADPGGDVGSRGIESSGTRQASTVAANGEVSCQLLPDAPTPRSNPMDRPSNRTESCFSIGVETMPVGVMTDDLWNAVATSRGTRPAPPPSGWSSTHRAGVESRRPVRLAAAAWRWQQPQPPGRPALDGAVQTLQCTLLALSPISRPSGAVDAGAQGRRGVGGARDV